VGQRGLRWVRAAGPGRGRLKRRKSPERRASFERCRHTQKVPAPSGLRRGVMACPMLSLAHSSPRRARVENKQGRARKGGCRSSVRNVRTDTECAAEREASEKGVDGAGKDKRTAGLGGSQRAGRDARMGLMREVTGSNAAGARATNEGRAGGRQSSLCGQLAWRLR